LLTSQLKTALHYTIKAYQKLGVPKFTDNLKGGKAAPPPFIASDSPLSNLFHVYIDLSASPRRTELPFYQNRCALSLRKNPIFYGVVVSPQDYKIVAKTPIDILILPLQSETQVFPLFVFPTIVPLDEVQVAIDANKTFCLHFAPSFAPSAVFLILLLHISPL
jgi:hypothetical protein